MSSCAPTSAMPVAAAPLIGLVILCLLGASADPEAQLEDLRDRIRRVQADIEAIRMAEIYSSHPLLRNAVLCFVLVSLVAAGIAGFFGAEIDDHAPVRGGATIHIMYGGRP